MSASDHFVTTALGALADELLRAARDSGSGRAARTVYGGVGRALRQTVIVLVAGHELAEHESPGEATLQVLRGSVALRTDKRSRDLRVGEHVTIPRERHALAALQDTAVLLTVSIVATAPPER